MEEDWRLKVEFADMINGLMMGNGEWGVGVGGWFVLIVKRR